MRVATVDGLVTLYYDGSKELWNRELHWEWYRARGFRNEDADVESLDLSDECKSYTRERLSWQQVIVVDGVTEIPDRTFSECFNIKRVIFADSVMRIQYQAFIWCKSLIYIEWSLRLEYIGVSAFNKCNLSSIFIPPGCRQIGDASFAGNANLTIFNVSQNAELDYNVIQSTKLIQSFPNTESEVVNNWLKNINHNDQFDLHRVCSSFEPTLDMILNTMIQKGGPNAFQVKNSIGITPSQYLKENPYTDVKEKDIIKKYVLQMTGEL